MIPLDKNTDSLANFKCNFSKIFFHTEKGTRKDLLVCFRVTNQQWNPRFPRLQLRPEHHPPLSTSGIFYYLPLENTDTANTQTMSTNESGSRGLFVEQNTS